MSGFATDTRQTSIANAKLSELDTLRENILRSGSIQFRINSQTNGYFQNTLGKNKRKNKFKKRRVRTASKNIPKRYIQQLD